MACRKIKIRYRKHSTKGKIKEFQNNTAHSIAAGNFQSFSHFRISFFRLRMLEEEPKIRFASVRAVCDKTGLE